MVTTGQPMPVRRKRMGRRRNLGKSHRRSVLKYQMGFFILAISCFAGYSRFREKDDQLVETGGARRLVGDDVLKKVSGFCSNCQTSGYNGADCSLAISDGSVCDAPASAHAILLCGLTECTFDGQTEFNSECSALIQAQADVSCKSEGRKSDFPKDLFTKEEKRNGALLIHIAVMCYMFAGLAIVCDVYFENALEGICEALQISEDVAGASFMAAGGSAPELFTSFVGTFVTKSDIGFGTIVGSAVFNVLFVIGICGLFAGGDVLQLTWYPLARDSSYYTLTLIAIVIIVEDGFVEWWESCILFAMYITYLTIMKFNERIKVALMTYLGQYKVTPKDEEVMAPAVETMRASAGTGSTTGDIGGEVPVAPEPKEGDTSPAPNGDIGSVNGDEEDDEDEDPLKWPEGKLDQLIFIINAPLNYTMAYTIPDLGKYPHLYMVAFGMCILHIAMYSYFMVWMSDEIGWVIGIPTPVMGVTVLAAGTSIPDALSSLAVAKRGFGDMAVSSSIGSNVFDITVGLPVPWLCYSLSSWYTGGRTHIIIESDTLEISVVTLLVMLFATVASIHLGGWKLTPKLSLTLVFLYFIFLTESLLLEYDQL